MRTLFIVPAILALLSAQLPVTPASADDVEVLAALLEQDQSENECDGRTLTQCSSVTCPPKVSPEGVETPQKCKRDKGKGNEDGDPLLGALESAKPCKCVEDKGS